MTGRFAPSTTGRAHPGTLLSGLLCWLDARSRGAEVILRLEDLDRMRCAPGLGDMLLRDLEWFGLDWDKEIWQSDLGAQHHAALDSLVASGLLYPCSCSRNEVRARARARAFGGAVYDGRCRHRSLPAGGWRATKDTLRVCLDDQRVEVFDVDGRDLSQNPLREFGDPIVRRRDGVVAYNLAVVVDDQNSGVELVVRGADLAFSTALQVGLHRCLGWSAPRYRHHLLLLQKTGGKLSKSHEDGDTLPVADAVDADPTALCGRIARLAGLVSTDESTTPQKLLETFSWDAVGKEDVVLADDFWARRC